MTLEGIDVSRYQSTTPSLAGRSFLWARATYGTWHDPSFSSHIANGRAAGCLVGAYAFGRATHSFTRNADGIVVPLAQPIADQVAEFLAAAGKVDFYALDMEPDKYGTAMSAAEAGQFIALAKAKVHPVLLYHSASGYPSLGQDGRWIADYRSATAAAGGPSLPWAFWQYRGSPLDLDRFNGTLAQLQALAGRTPTRFRAAISGPTPLYVRPNGARLPNGVSRATYVCTRAKVAGLWWYCIKGNTSLAGRWFKPSRFTAITRV